MDIRPVVSDPLPRGKLTAWPWEASLNAAAYIRARRALAVWAANAYARTGLPLFADTLPEAFNGGQEPKKCVGAARRTGESVELVALAFTPRLIVSRLMIAQTAPVFDVMADWKRHSAGYVHAWFHPASQLGEPFIYLDAEFSDRAVRRLAALEIAPEFNRSDEANKLGVDDVLRHTQSGESP